MVRNVGLKSGIRFQPSEITKIGLIVAFAGYFTEHRDKIGTFEYGFFKPMVAVGIPVVILFAVQSHLSAAILIFSVCSCIMIVAGTRIKYFAELGAVRRLWNSCPPAEAGQL